MSTIDTTESRKLAGSFLSALMDLSFASFITLKLIRVLYIFAMLLGVVTAIGTIVAAFNVNSAAGVAALVVSPVIFLLVLVLFRVQLELVAIVFRIAENTERIPPRF